MKIMLPLSLLAVTLAGCATPPQIASAPAEPAPSFAGSVSAADPRAQAAGEAMLARGGSATDAAIAIMLALTVVEPQSSGIGGGGFMVRGTADGVVSTFDGRETAPAGATPEWFLDASGNLPPRSESVRSGLSVGVPGNIALAAKAHAAHGKLPWADLFAPA
ncbi:MAG: gamma-glutamyltransferase, partial [Pseudomonadota bacterium]|nr:gamma-glutamyltransferase [Pseudomonadota bacterium]